MSLSTLGTRSTLADRRIWAATLVLGIIVALAFPFAAGSGGAIENGLHVPWWLMFVPFVLCDGLELRFRVGGSVVFATLIELPYVVALFAMPSGELLAACSIGLVIALTVLRYRPTMVAYNLAGTAFEWVLAVSVFHAIAPPSGVVGLRGWVGAVLAMMSCATAGSLRNVLLAALRGRPLDRRWPAVAAVALAVAAINSTLAFLALRLVLIDPLLVWLVGGLAVVLIVVYRNYISLLSHHEGLNRLYESTQTFELVTAHEGSVRTMLDQSVELLAAETAELALFGPDPLSVRYFRSEHGRSAFELDGPSGTPAMRDALRDVEAGTEADRFGGIESHDRRSMVARLQGADGPIGVLAVTMHAGMEFSEGDRRLFEMFVNHASVALQNSQLVDQLRDEVAQREHEALHDALTALPNRVMFDLQTRRAVGESDDDRLVAVALLDIDHFKEVNDTLGHHHGDALLEALARRLDELAHERGLVVSRLGGDEFAVLITGAATADEIGELVAEVKSTIEESVEIASVPVDIAASVGVAVLDRAVAGVDGSTLLRQADVAMYIAKRQHRGIVFYDRADDPYSPKRLSLAADLRHAVERGEIEAYFQPEIDLHTGDVISVEALARWTHAEHGAIVPDQFIPIAEQSGLIRDLTYLMLEQSLTRIRQWRSHGFDLHVAVNLSVRCLSDEHLVERVMRHLELAGLGPSCLTLEVTEGTIMADPEHAHAVLGRLHDQGIRLSIDDFGMGYSSLAQLKRMPVGQLKVDRSFVTYVSEDNDDAAIVKSVTDLGHNLGLEVIAEGVENRVTLDKLIDLGCDSVQGFFLARPMSADQTLTWLRERERNRGEPGFDPKFAIAQIV